MKRLNIPCIFSAAVMAGQAAMAQPAQKAELPPLLSNMMEALDVHCPISQHYNMRACTEHVMATAIAASLAVKRVNGELKRLGLPDTDLSDSWIDSRCGTLAGFDRRRYQRSDTYVFIQLSNALRCFQIMVAAEKLTVQNLPELTHRPLTSETVKDLVFGRVNDVSAFQSRQPSR